MIKNHKTLVLSTVILLTCFSQFYLSSELWIPVKRDFPFVPFFELIPLKLNHGFRIVLLGAMLLSFAFTFMFPKRKDVLCLFCFCSLIFVLEDAMRLQPWFYLHILMLSVIALESRITQEKVLLYLQFILIGIYFWGGFNKLNLAFAWEVFPWLVSPFDHDQIFYPRPDNFNSIPLPAINYIAYVIPFIEILLALFLFIPKYRFTGIVLCLLTHVFSLLAIGPLGQNWNSVVWPWNVEMPILCFLLFYKSNQVNYLSECWQALRSKLGIIVVFLFLCVPTLSFFNLWDKGMAFHLYSGNTMKLEFHFDGFQEKLIDKSFASHLSLDTTSMTSFMKVRSWSNDQLNTPMYGTTRHLKKVGHHLCDCLDKSDNGRLLIINRSGFLSKPDTTVVKCADLE